MAISMDMIESERVEGNTPTLRLFALLEVIAEKDSYFSLQSLSEELGIPKPTLHRMLQQLESARLIIRDGDGRQYSTGRRLHQMAEKLLLNNTIHGSRRAVLRHLVEEIGESCNITACSGNEVLYLDRVETVAPLRFYLHPGSRVPLHCSASGKLFLSQMSSSQCRRLLEAAPLEQYTPNTLTRYDAIEQEIELVRRQGYAMDNEEFLPGLICIAVLVPGENGKSNVGIAAQSPIMRINREKALEFLPVLRRAADSLAEIEKANAAA